jgi:hypothetical protein
MRIHLLTYSKLDPQVFPPHLRCGTIPAGSQQDEHCYARPTLRQRPTLDSAPACSTLRSPNSSIRRSGIPARHRVVEYAPSRDVSPRSGKVARPTGLHLATSLCYTPPPSEGNTCGSSLALARGEEGMTRRGEAGLAPTGRHQAGEGAFSTARYRAGLPGL